MAETETVRLPLTNKEVGIDMGLAHFAVLSSGAPPIENPKYYRTYEQKLAKAQRRLSRRQPGGNNYHKAKMKVARIHERIVNRRKDFLDKVSTHIVKNHDMIAVEDLQVEQMLQERQYSKSIQDVSWSKFRSMLKYKASWFGRQFVVVDRTFPERIITISHWRSR